MGTGFHYPKLGWLFAAFVLAYWLFSFPWVWAFFSHLGNLSYFGVFAAGLLFSYGFTSPFAAGLFLALKPENVFLAALIGGFGALLSDLLIFSFIRSSFFNEFERLKHTKIAEEVDGVVTHALGRRIKHYLVYAFAGFFIASPLPDEAGIILFAGASKIDPRKLAALSFFLNTLGILVLLLI